MNGFINKIRYWDNLAAKWMMRHFYIMFFQIILVTIIFFWFVNTISTIDLSQQSQHGTLAEKILVNMSSNMTILVFLVILNSFWLLFMFNGLIRLRSTIRDIHYSLSRMKTKIK